MHKKLIINRQLCTQDEEETQVLNTECQKSFETVAETLYLQNYLQYLCLVKRLQAKHRVVLGFNEGVLISH